MPAHPFSLVILLSASMAGAAPAPTVDGDAALRAALRAARPGTHLRIAAGRYQPGVYAAKLHGTAEQPIVIEGADPADPPRFEGGGEGWHVSDCSHLVLRNIAVRGQSSNGINIDDGGTFDTPSHHITLEGLQVRDIGPRGNHDAIKLSGVDDFVVRDCTIEGWGGQAVDMVGCHRGLIERSTFRGKAGFSQDAGPQTKGGSSQIVVRRCFFDHAAARGVQLGGSTSLSVFRPQGARYEARQITVEGCLFLGCQAPVTFVGVDGAVFRYNTIVRPEKWILRILQETTQADFAPCRNGHFERNVIVFRRADVDIHVNIGPHTRPDTFTFANNWWYCEDRPAGSRPRLPVAESGGVYGEDPRFASPVGLGGRPQNPRAATYGHAAQAAE